MFKSIKNKIKTFKSDRTAFTLVELIVVIAVIGILVLVAVPKFIGYTQKAELTKIRNNVKVVETAAGVYHVHNEDWPRLTDVPYTAEELTEFAEKIYSITGEVIELDVNGNFYNIDWGKMSPHMKKPKDAELYILQNPVGKVFYLNNLTQAGQVRIDSLREGRFLEITSEIASTDASHFIFDSTTGTIIGYSDEGPKDVIIPSQIDGVSVTAIGMFAFMDKGLTSVVIPEGVNNIGDLAFAGTPNLNFETGEMVVVFGNNITNIVLPDSLEHVGEAAFSGNKISELSLSANTKTIAAEAFYSNLIKTVVIPAGVVSIGKNAFDKNPVVDIYLPENMLIVDPFMAGVYELSYDLEGAGHYTMQPFGETLLWVPMVD